MNGTMRSHALYIKACVSEGMSWLRPKPNMDDSKKVARILSDVTVNAYFRLITKFKKPLSQVNTSLLALGVASLGVSSLCDEAPVG